MSEHTLIRDDQIFQAFKAGWMSVFGVHVASVASDEVAWDAYNAWLNEADDDRR